MPTDAADDRINNRRIQDDPPNYPDMTPELKRRCLDRLVHSLETMRSVESELQRASKENEAAAAAKLVQVMWKGKSSLTFTKEDFAGAFEHVCRGSAIPRIYSVEMQDNFELDSEKHLKPIRMCFIKFLTPEDARRALAHKELTVIISTGSSVQVKFITPLQRQSTHAAFRHVWGLIERLNNVDLELKQLGAMRPNLGTPVLSPLLVDKAWYETMLEKMKRERASGRSLELHCHGTLASLKPVDIASLNAQIKTLYDEECDILLELRERQLHGMKFNFKHPSIQS
jgi:hypothetical protein